MLTEYEKQVLEIARERGKVTKMSARKVFDGDKVEAKKCIKRLEDKGVLEKMNAPGYFQVADSYDVDDSTTAQTTLQDRAKI